VSGNLSRTFTLNSEPQGGARKDTRILNSDQFSKSYDECSHFDSRFNVVKVFLKSAISTILKLVADIGDKVNFQDLGMESLMMMMIEKKNSPGSYVT
jgi:hypothetical protein